MACTSSSLKWPVTVLLFSAALLSGCQTVPGAGSGSANGKAVSGEIAQSRHGYVFAAIDSLMPVLSTKNVQLGELPLETSLSSALPNDAASKMSKQESLRKLAELHLVGAGPYQIVYSDTTSGRLEYRSQDSDMHVAFMVRPANESENKNNQSFVITDIIGQTALSTLVNDTAKGGLNRVATNTSAGSIDYAEVARNSADEDINILAHFNSLPQVEQDREDLLALRAMLMLRMGQDKLAKPLVEQGIVRYPKSATYFSLASVLLQRADRYGDIQAELISSIMNQRFTRAEINASRNRVAAFLAIEKVI